jgi:beta-glucosidase
MAMAKYTRLGFIFSFSFLGIVNLTIAKKNTMYHQGWIDFNKNSVLYIFENPALPVEKPIEDLLSKMAMEEKINQCATLYGYQRVLKDELLTPL